MAEDTHSALAKYQYDPSILFTLKTLRYQQAMKYSEQAF